MLIYMLGILLFDLYLHSCIALCNTLHIEKCLFIFIFFKPILCVSHSFFTFPIYSFVLFSGIFLSHQANCLMTVASFSVYFLQYCNKSRFLTYILHSIIRFFFDVDCTISQKRRFKETCPFQVRLVSSEIVILYQHFSCYATEIRNKYFSYCNLFY